MSFCDMQKLFLLYRKLLSCTALFFYGIPKVMRCISCTIVGSMLKYTQICMFRGIVKMCTNDNIRLAI